LNILFKSYRIVWIHVAANLWNTMDHCCISHPVMEYPETPPMALHTQGPVRCGAVLSIDTIVCWGIEGDDSWAAHLLFPCSWETSSILTKYLGQARSHQHCAARPHVSCLSTHWKAWWKRFSSQWLSLISPFSLSSMLLETFCEMESHLLCWTFWM
jgi:hypothetical protein